MRIASVSGRDVRIEGRIIRVACLHPDKYGSLMHPIPHSDNLLTTRIMDTIFAQVNAQAAVWEKLHTLCLR